MKFDFAQIKDVLLCPKSHSELMQYGDTLICTDENCRLQFEIREGIPIMLVDDATELSPEDWSAAIQQKDENPSPEESSSEA
ncbi:MAG: hypothetical protein Tsb009_22520 [Planctomycetaceae bacterium]